MRVRSFIDMSRLKVSMQEEDEKELVVLKHLPTSMRRQVIKESHSWYLISNPVFLGMKSCNDRCLERICCDALRSLWVIPDETVFNFGEIGVGMYFVTRGKLNYLRYPALLHNFTMNGGLLGGIEARAH